MQLALSIVRVKNEEEKKTKFWSQTIDGSFRNKIESSKMALNHDGWEEIFSELQIIERVNASG